MYGKEYEVKSERINHDNSERVVHIVCDEDGVDNLNRIFELKGKHVMDGFTFYINRIETNKSITNKLFDAYITFKALEFSF
jgi:hypothetical protein